MTISLETQEKAKEIILAGLRAQSHGSVRFCDAEAEVAWNAIDEEFLDVSIIYEGPHEDLNIHLLNALHGEIEPQLLKIGVLQIPSVSCIPKAEYDRLLSEKAAARPWDRRG